MPRPNPDDGYRVALIDLAKEVATAGTGTPKVGGGGERAAFLRRFRVAYRHLAGSVELPNPQVPGEYRFHTETEKELTILEGKE